jgi:hypothetical protein
LLFCNGIAFANYLQLQGVFIMNKKQTPKPPETSLRGRDARTGEFIPVSEARRRPATTVVERVPLPGKGRK